MKKIMIMLGAVAMAACVQAAAVSWSTGALKTANADGSFTGTNLSGTWANYDVTVTFYADNAGTMGAALTGITGNTDTSASLGNFGATTSDSFAAGGEYWAQVVITATTKADTPVTYTMTSDAVKFTAPDTGNLKLNFSTEGAMPGAWSTADVPEPTSGLLLLLGVAGLALKRKRA